ncbi:hypothetical protein LPJ63_001866 [Coemansia sp. RSA 2711]|nr:hypothetical protein LPJ63_001866 [Coemansia sp. RSA 2711]
MDWAHLFKANANTSSAGAGSLDTGFGHTPLPSQTAGALGLQFGSVHPLRPGLSAPPQQPQFSFVSQPALPTGSGESIVLSAPTGTLFDSSEEAYLNSFLSSFDFDGVDATPYIGSPPTMANISSRTDFAGMGMGMGVGAGMMGTMDDAIPHLSLEDNSNDAAHGLSRMSTHPAGHNSRTGPNNSFAQPSTTLFDYGLGGTSHLSLGNVMSEEMSKVSSWLLQNQQQSPFPSSTSNPLGLNSPITGSRSHAAGAGQPFTSSFSHGLHLSASTGFGEDQAEFPQYPAPVSESEFSVKRKASHDQLDQPRKSRGNVRSPEREEIASLNISLATDSIQTGSMLSPRTPTTPSIHRRPSEARTGGSAKRRDSKKAAQRGVLTEEERRANHIASEQRRRNQIRQGYAELMSLVTTLQDPALGNHPGTAQSTPSKAVILTHAVQFIRDIEEGNQRLRRQLEGARGTMPQMQLSSQALAAFNPHSPTPPK